jgi:drug/metabolite transporter (DMT)-like permease
LKNTNYIAYVALIVVTAIWGSTFVVVKEAVAQMPVMDFLGMRFLLAAAVMFIIRPNCLKGMSSLGYKRAILLGVILALAFITQTYGLKYTSAAVSGFITGMFVVFTPVIAWILLNNRIGSRTWFAVFLAVIGLGFLSLRGWSVGYGEILTLGCAILFALHIVGLGRWSVSHDTYGLAFLQVLTVGAISIIAATPQGIIPPPDLSVWGAVIITGILASALAYVVQTWVQSLLEPTKVAITMTMEPVFAGLTAVLIGGEELTLLVLIGAAFVLVAMILTVYRDKTENRKSEL